MYEIVAALAHSQFRMAAGADTGCRRATHSPVVQQQLVLQESVVWSSQQSIVVNLPRSLADGLVVRPRRSRRRRG
ncbi:hypothetical protein C1I92_02730 [Jiangella anatolica]|uniref:Uncharacterized protein n=1 Tax=Jiangella anatolica TaxID=2670374 RepID=A0A2W2D0R9_9ACTN|nr:hypothetical protein C1I92_02730 [Jiangella anatolica]